MTFQTMSVIFNSRLVCFNLEVYVRSTRIEVFGITNKRNLLRKMAVFTEITYRNTNLLTCCYLKPCGCKRLSIYIRIYQCTYVIISTVIKYRFDLRIPTLLVFYCLIWHCLQLCKWSNVSLLCLDRLNVHLHAGQCYANLILFRRDNGTCTLIVRV